MAEPLTNASEPRAPKPPGAPDGYRRHFLGRFGEAILARLGRAEALGEIDGRDVFLVVDSIELGDNPLDEEIGIDFHLSHSPPPPDYVPHWGSLAPILRVERPLDFDSKPSLEEGRYSFVFTSAMSVAENEAEFLEFLEDEARLKVPRSVTMRHGINAPIPNDQKAGPTRGIA
jgi:hypothetical protein